MNMYLLRPRVGSNHAELGRVERRHDEMVEDERLSSFAKIDALCRKVLTSTSKQPLKSFGQKGTWLIAIVGCYKCASPLYFIPIMDVDETQTPLLPVELQTLSTLLEQSPEALASGSQEIQHAAIQAAKHIFDFCMSNLSLKYALY